MSRPRCRVRPSAFRLWDEFSDVSHLLTDVVDALETLPREELETRSYLRPPGVVHEAAGTVFGRRFRVRGVRDADGKWLEVWSVAPL